MTHPPAETSDVVTQALVFLAATCVVVPALKKARLSAVMGFLLIGVGAAAVWINNRYIRRGDGRSGSQKGGADGSRSSGAPAGA